VDELIIDIAGLTTAQQALRPIQTQWPPSHIGFVPDSHTEPLHVVGLENVSSCTVSVISSSNGLVNHPGSNPLLAIWSATRQCIGNYDYLILPPKVPGEIDSKWIESHHPGFPSNKIMVRTSYDKAFSIFLVENAKLYREASDVALRGTSGLGKTFFHLSPGLALASAVGRRWIFFRGFCGYLYKPLSELALGPKILQHLSPSCTIIIS